MMAGHGERRFRKQEQAIAALLAEPTIAAAAVRAGVSEVTLQRWLREPSFAAAYRRERRRVVESAVARIQAAMVQAVDTLLAVTKGGAKESDRVRAAKALLDYAFRGLTDADALHGAPETTDGNALNSGDLVMLLAARLQQLDRAELPTGEKARLTAALGDSLLRAFGVDVIDKRLEALQAVLLSRKEKHR
jgi:hypothetical protein